MSLLGKENETIGVLDFVASSSGWMTIADPTAIDIGTFLRGETRLQAENQGVVLRRRPRRLVPLRRDEILQAYVECERITLGDDFMLLVRSEIASHVNDILRQCTDLVVDPRRAAPQPPS
jgi:hypothetical protein